MAIDINDPSSPDLLSGGGQEADWAATVAPATAAQILKWYKQYLGRDASPDEIGAHQGNPGGAPAVEELIRTSEEATARTGDGGTAANYTSWWNPSDPQGSWARLVAGKPANSETLLSLRPYLEAIGGRLENPNAVGITSKIYLPGQSGAIRVGNYFDGGGTPSWGWMGQGDGGGGGGNQAPTQTVTYGPSPNPDFGTQPAEYASQPWTGGAGEAPALPANLQSPYVAPTFVAPTQAEAEAEPGYLTRMAAGQRTLESSAAARGTVLSGGTQKALARYGQEFGANEYDKVYGRNLQTFGVNAGLKLGERQQNVGEFGDLVGRAQQNYKNRYGQWLDENSRSLTNYATNVGAKREWEQDYWGRLMDLYKGGQNAAATSYQPGVA